MKQKTGKIIMGASLSLAAIAIAVDHIQHRLPEIEPVPDQEQKGFLQQGAPCGLGGGEEAPCSLGGGGRFNDL